MFAFSAPPHSGLMRPTARFSPGLSFAPISMLSSTVMRDSAFVSWNVRTMPARATLDAAVLPSVRPSNDHLAASADAPEELLRRRRLVEAGDQVEERRLAGAVRTDQRGDRAALHLEVADVDGRHPAEAALDVVDHEDGIGLGRAGGLRDVQQCGADGLCDRAGLVRDRNGAVGGLVRH
jgi:hypothetical protein